MKYQEVLDFLYSQLPMYQRIGAKALNHDLAKTIAIHEYLGNPQNNFKTIHVAGTNGKGSTVHMLSSVLQDAGYTVGLYTSPHLKSFRERIRLNGQMISEDFVISFVEKIKPVIKELKPSFFEITVAMAYDYFASSQVDIAVIETGLGGRLDSTNIITPEVAVITSIGLDHQDILGQSIAEIAAEKAGIIKQNIPIVLGQVDDEAFHVIEKMAVALHSPFYDAKNYYSVIDADERFDLVKKGDLFIENLTSDLKGASTSLNLPAVVTTLDILRVKDFDWDHQNLRKGLQNVCKQTGLLGRWQILSLSPLTICDIGHNESAVAVLVQRLEQLNKPLRIVWGMNSDKSVDKILDLLPDHATYYFCAAKLDRALSAVELQDQAAKKGLQGKAYKSVDDAYKDCISQASKDDVVFVGGSTFVVAELEGL